MDVIESSLFLSKLALLGRLLLSCLSEPLCLGLLELLLALPLALFWRVGEPVLDDREAWVDDIEDEGLASSSYSSST